MSTDNMINAAADDAAIMPTIANKNPDGFWHNWPPAPVTAISKASSPI